MMPPVLVTGATGLLGNNVVRQLLDRGHLVRVLVRESSDPRPLAGLDVEIVRGDIRDADNVRDACSHTSCVIHSAAYVQVGRSRLDLHRAVNIEGSRNVVEAARMARVRMIHVSSVDALGIGSIREPADEDTPLAKPVPCAYAITKREAEQVVLQAVHRGLDGVIVNPGFMLGPWDWRPSSGQMLLEVAKGRAILAPRGWFSVCDVRDVASGILAAMERAQTGRRYIMAGESITYLKAWRLFAEVSRARRPWASVGPVSLWFAGMAGDLRTRLTGREPYVNSGAIALARKPKCYCSRRAETELGYRTRPFRNTVQDAWSWFQENGFVRPSPIL